jgi:hypothetical protein
LSGEPIAEIDWDAGTFSRFVIQFKADFVAASCEQKNAENTANDTTAATRNVK